LTPRESVDVAILGAGPAGCCAALRLLTLGHRVAVVEHRAFPRSQIGEALSPGIWNLLDYVHATDTIHEAGCLRDVPTRIVWERRVSEVIPAQQHRAGVVVDRAAFDARLLALATNAGVIVFQPARAQRIDGGPGAWRLFVAGADQTVSLQNRTRPVAGR